PQALLAGGELAQIGVAHLAERLEPGAAFHGRHHLVLCETDSDPADQSAEQVLLRAEAVAHEPAAVARLLADLGQRGAAVALAGDQLDRRAQDELLREGGPLGLGAPARRLLRAPGGGSRVDRPRHGSPPPPGARPDLVPHRPYVAHIYLLINPSVSWHLRRPHGRPRLERVPAPLAGHPLPRLPRRTGLRPPLGYETHQMRRVELY